YGASFLLGLTNGATLYFVVTALVNGTEGTPSPVYGPVTIGTPMTTGVSVEGTVSLSGFTPTGPLCLGIFREENFFGKCFSTPATVQPFQFDNVPDGYYQVFASVDMNNNGVEDPGDISVGGLPGSTLPILVQGAPVSGVTVTLVNTSGDAAVYTQYEYPSSYTLFFEGKNNSKLITNMTVTSGPNLTQPIDVPWDDGYFDTWSYNLPGRPTIGDTYNMRLRYSDGTIETPSSAVTDILDGYSTPVSPSGTIIGLTPLMTWSQPSSPPLQLPFTYTIRVTDSSGTEFWNPERIPSNRTYAIYNEDGTAVPLVSGAQYYWDVRIVDKHGNRGIGPIVSFTPMAPTLNITINGPGTGDVKSSPTGISCGLSCSAQFPQNQAVILSATPATGGSIFSGWGGD
ncbi:MAG TPA: hypothetical protein VJ508_11930, partial [Saprospiraceae bacterium]|nr:hypothetical protein [Saprospiraceae bacterium]